MMYYITWTSGMMWLGNLLKPMLGRGELRCIGATTLDEFRKYIEKDPALERRFQQVLVQEPSVIDTISILRGLRERCVHVSSANQEPYLYLCAGDQTLSRNDGSRGSQQACWETTMPLSYDIQLLCHSFMEACMLYTGVACGSHLKQLCSGESIS